MIYDEEGEMLTVGNGILTAPVNAHRTTTISIVAATSVA